MDWSLYPNFEEHEFACSHTGRCEMDPQFLAMLQALRTMIGRPFMINSGYRDRSHPVEAKKASPGAHAYGCAADIACHGELAYLILAFAPKVAFQRLGFQQKGPIDRRFIHLDTWGGGPSPAVWTY